MSNESAYKENNGVPLTKDGHCYREGLGYAFDGGSIKSISRGMKDGMPTITLTGYDADIERVGASISRELGVDARFTESDLDHSRTPIAAVQVKTGDMAKIIQMLTDPNRTTFIGADGGHAYNATYIPEHAKEFILEQEAVPSNLITRLGEIGKRIGHEMNHYSHIVAGVTGSETDDERLKDFAKEDLQGSVIPRIMAEMYTGQDSRTPSSNRSSGRTRDNGASEILTALLEAEADYRKQNTGGIQLQAPLSEAQAARQVAIKETLQAAFGVNKVGQAIT